MPLFMDRAHKSVDSPPVICSTLEGWMTESISELGTGFEQATPGLVLERCNH